MILVPGGSKIIYSHGGRHIRYRGQCYYNEQPVNLIVERSNFLFSGSKACSVLAPDPASAQPANPKRDDYLRDSTGVRRMKRIKRRVGDILEIRLGDGYLAFGQVLKEPLVAFFDVRSKERLQIGQLLGYPVAFSVWVMRYGITQGGFEVIGHAEVVGSIDQHPPFFKVDNIAKKLFITYDGSEDIPATATEVQGLERAAAWEPEHLVDRLNDHFAGRPNIWVERLKAP